MATIDLGRIKFKWQGAYNAATAYVVDDVVESGGSAYVCIAATTGNTPPNATYWELMSQKGVDADLFNISGTVQGDLYFNNGSAIARLPIGSAGQALKVNSGATGFDYGVAGGILQVKSATKTDTQSINNGSTYEEVTGLSVTLTPSSASNKVLILVQLSVGLGSSGIASAQLKRNGTSIGIGDQVGSNRSRVTIGMDNGAGFGDGVMSMHGQFLDAPSSTSALTYKVHASMHGTSNDLQINIADTSTDATNNFVAISTITAMEIASGVL